MEAKESRTRWTWAEFARLPSEGSTRYEVIDGELAVTPSPTPRHQKIAARLTRILDGFTDAHALGHVLGGPVDVLFAEGDYLEPDLVFLRADRTGIVTDRGIEGPPDLVVEILSPSTANRDRGVKLERYRLYGVPEYWIVDPEGRTVEVWRLGQGAESGEVFETGSTLRWRPGPGAETLEVEVGEVFRGTEELTGA
ncbi:MAG: Uma2 family endonuclease [Gemmatimonadota bacterium]|jgi:Uma2 family endonuclease